VTTTVLTDTFTDTSGTLLSAHTADSGATWGTWFAGAGDYLPICNVNGRVARHASATTTYTFAISDVSHTYTNERVNFTVVHSGTSTSWANVGCRATTAGGGSGYWCRVSRTQAEFYRTNAGSTVQISTTGTITADTDGSYDFIFEVISAGDDSSVTLTLYQGGSSVYTKTDSSGSRLLTRGKILVGAYNNADFATTVLTATNDDPPSSNTIDISTPIAAAILQRTPGASTGSLPVTGVYTGTPTTIEARLVDDGTSTPVSGFDWATVVASPSGGVFSFSFASVPVALSWRNVQVRFSNDTACTDTSGKVTLGDVIAYWGQSNARYAFETYGSSTLTPDSMCRAYGNTVGGGSAWTVLDTAKMDGPITLANALIAQTSVPIGLISCGVGGTAIATWIPGQAQWTQAIAHVNATGANLGGVIWIQGEADVDVSSQATYNTKLGEVFDSGLRTTLSNTSMPVILVTIGYQNTGNTDAGTEDIRAAQAAWCAAAPTKNLRVERWDLQGTGTYMADTVHLNAAGHVVLANRLVRAWRYATGNVATYRGPKISTVTQVSSTVIDVNLTHDFGADITLGTAGWRVTTGGTPGTVSGVTKTSATKVQITMSAPCTPATVGYAYGPTPSVSSVLRDDSALTLPLEWNGGTLASSVSVASFAGGCNQLI